MYDSLTITRKLYFVKPNLILINDSAEGEKMSINLVKYSI